MANIIDVLLRVNDQLSPAVNGITRGILQANVITAGFNTLINTATSGITAFSNAVIEGANAQTALTQTAGSMATILGSSYEEAEAYVLSLQTRLAELAANLPGETEGYVSFFRTIADDLAIANRELNSGRFDAESYGDQVETVVGKFQVLAEAAQATEKQTMAAFQGFMNATGSVAALNVLDFFGKNPALTNALDQLVGDRQLGDLSKGEKLTILMEGLNIALTDDTIMRMSDDLNSIYQGLMSNLFDPTTGLFGLNRELRENVEGQQTVLTGLNDMAIALFLGDDSLLGRLSNLFQKMGFELGDPMEALYQATQWATTQIERATNFIDNIAGFFDKVNDRTLTGKYALDQIGDKLFEWSTMFGESLEVLIPVISQTFLDMAAIAIKGLVFVASNINWGAIINGLYTGIGNALIQAFSPENLGNTLTVGAAALLTPALLAYVPAIAAALFNPLLGVVALGGIALVSAYQQNWDDVVLGIRYSFSEFNAMMQSYGNVIGQSIVNFALDVKIFVLEIFNKLKNALMRTVSSLDELFGDRFSPLSSSPLPGNLGRSLDSGTSTGSRLGRSLGNLGRAEGQFPSSFANILSSLANEQRRSPGTTPVIANSSELILNRSQQATLAGSLGGRSPSLSIGNITINAGNSANPEELAEKVMSAIGREWEAYASRKMSALVT